MTPRSIFQVFKKKFYAAIQLVPLSSQEKIDGPDGFPYVKVSLDGNENTNQFFIHDLISACLEEGRGIVCFDAEGNMLWVFTYGSVRSFSEKGVFEVFADENGTETFFGPESETVQKARHVMTGKPSGELFPQYARAVVKKYLEAHGVVNPGVVLIVDPTFVPSQLLIFTVFREDFPDEQSFQTVMGQLYWFFPNPFGVVTISKEAALGYEFEAL